MGFNKGSEAIEKEVKDEKAALAARNDRLDFFSLSSDGDDAILRFLTDGPDWIKVAQHSFIKTKAAPKEAKSWPKAMGAVCRYDKQIADMFGDCYICDNELTSNFKPEFVKPSGRVWALAVVRQQIKGDGSEQLGGEEKRGKIVGVGDYAEEYEILDKDGKPTNKKGVRPKIVIVNMSWQNFFAALHHAWSMHGTICDRDFVVKRTGTGTDTTYNIMPMDRTEKLTPSTQAWQRYTNELTTREIDLDDLVLKQASDEHYALWFDKTKALDKDGKIVSADSVASTTSNAASSTDDSTTLDEPNEETKRQMETIRARLMPETVTITS